MKPAMFNPVGIGAGTHGATHGPSGQNLVGRALQKIRLVWGKRQLNLARQCPNPIPAVIRYEHDWDFGIFCGRFRTTPSPQRGSDNSSLAQARETWFVMVSHPNRGCGFIVFWRDSLKPCFCFMRCFNVQTKESERFASHGWKSCCPKRFFC